MENGHQPLDAAPVINYIIVTPQRVFFLLETCPTIYSTPTMTVICTTDEKETVNCTGADMVPWHGSAVPLSMKIFDFPSLISGGGSREKFVKKITKS
jgi:hypothetical protein